MTRDDIRKLLGGYATDSLTEAERKTLFDAALDDQELFDELAQEQALKEALDESGVKQRLIASLAPRPKAWWLQPWPWVAVAAAAVVVGIVLLRPPATQQIAEVRIPAPRLEAPPANAPEQPSEAIPAQPPAAARRRQEPKPELPLELRREPPPEFQNFAQDKAEPPKAPEAAQTAVQTAAPAQPVMVTPPAAPPATPPALPPTTSSEAIVVTGALAFRAPTVEQGQQGQQGQQAQQGAVAGGGGGAGRGGRGGGGRGGGRGGARPAAAPVQAVQSAAAKDADANVAARFAFDYSVTPDGRLRIVPASDGFLTVTVSDGSTSQVLLSDRPVQAAAAVEVPVPGDSTLTTIVFARNAGAGAATGVGGLVGAIFDPPSGTKTDPAPSANSRLQAIIQLTPRQ